MKSVNGSAFERVLVAVDGSAPSRAALRLALRLARATGSRLIFCHAVETERIYAEFGASGLDPAPIIEERRREARDLLDAACDEARSAGLDADEALVEGAALEVILNAAKARRADLLVMGTHGRRGFQRWTLGSVAERVVRQANCPVLTVHGEEGVGREAHG